MERPLLEVAGLRTRFDTYRGPLVAADRVSFELRRGETLALVGESGCGKSVTATSIMRLVRRPGLITHGQVFFRGEDLLRLPERAMRRLRGRRMAMVFQDPLSTLNPAFTVGSQITESLRVHGVARGRAARDQAAELLAAMGLPSPRERLRSYPHELSGGMRQRVMIAIAVSCSPELIIADEPTTALDVTLQAQIMELLASIRTKRGLSMILITHDLGLVSRFCDRAAVMYAGRIVEYATVPELLARPLHPYTEGLLKCIPRLGRPDIPVTPIEGAVPDLASPPPACRFAPRCPYVMARCEEREPPDYRLAGGRLARCYLREGESEDALWPPEEGT
jgi:oligopeptide/dipeptide ABC transporter ATP-binding protein